MGRAIDLKPASWATIDSSSDEKARVALAGLLQLAAVACDDGTLPDEAIHVFDDTGVNLIPHWILALNAWLVANGPLALIHSFGKIGRNDLCLSNRTKSWG